MLFANQPWFANSFWEALGAAGAFGVMGIFMLALGFKVFEWITPKLNLEKELAEKNVAVGTMVAGLLVGIAIIVSRAIGG
jgi:putative membrane protein